MSNPTTDSPINTCFCCKKLKHGDVVFSAKTKEDVMVHVHPECVQAGSGVKSVEQVHIFVEAGRSISPAKELVIKKRLKAIQKAVAIANAKREQEANK